MKFFRLHWLHGEKSVVSGEDIADAFRQAGYGGGALGALDYYEPIKDEERGGCA